MRSRRIVFLLGVIISAGCSGLTSPASLDGAWAEERTIPGNSLSFTLTTNGDAVSGTGTWTGEACCAGTVTINGETTGGTVNLTFVFVTNGMPMPPRTSQFSGRVANGDMIGAFGGEGSSTAVTFLRTD